MKNVFFKINLVKEMRKFKSTKHFLEYEKDIQDSPQMFWMT